MLRRIQIIAVIVVLLIGLVGCISTKPTEVGVWFSEKENINMTLNKDGTFSVKDLSLQDGDLLAGTYRMEGNQFLYKPTGETEIANTYTLTKDTLVLTYGEYTSTLKRVKK